LSVPSSDTKAKVVLRKALHVAGFRYGLNRRGLPGTPGLVFPGWGAILFVDGCFWQRHPGCRHATAPSTNVAFWSAKFARNVERAACKAAELRALGWRVAVLWECEVRHCPLKRLLERVAIFLSGKGSDLISGDAPDPALGGPVNSG
jgi:DNA mismatch endonuclease (patch repair protein)